MTLSNEVFGWYSKIHNWIILRSLRTRKKNEKYVFVCFALQRIVPSLFRMFDQNLLKYVTWLKTLTRQLLRLKTDTKQAFNHWINSLTDGSPPTVKPDTKTFVLTIG